MSRKNSLEAKKARRELKVVDRDYGNFYELKKSASPKPINIMGLMYYNYLVSKLNLKVAK
ncbi:MAG: hypothetical protein JHC33_07815 [Ignisphaera sp.]|nr:hypothetical protein [Ignisphaera sp.]